MGFPRVTVCIPTYNGESYLAACLDSVVSQTYDDFEVLIVDDCSKDETLAIATEYARKDERIRLVTNERNLGLVGNWNRCIKLAQSEWIKFVFQDDLIAPECLEHMLAASADSKTLLTVCRRDFIYESASDEIRNEYQKFTEALSIEAVFPRMTEIPARDFCRGVLDHGSANFIGEPTAALIHHDAISRYGTFNPNLIQLCDLEYWIRVGINEGITYVPETLAHFRVHAHSTTSANNTGRAYLKDVIDPLLLQHEFAFNPLYATLRACARTSPYRRNLRREFSKMALWVRASATSQSLIFPGDPNQSPLGHWKRLARLYPKLESGMHLIPGKFRRWLESTITWRFHV